MAAPSDRDEAAPRGAATAAAHDDRQAAPRGTAFAAAQEERQRLVAGQPGHSPVQGRPIEVKVDERGVERALRRLRRVMAAEGVLREIKRRRHYEKPSVRRNRKLREAVRRRRKKAKMEQE